MATETLTPKAAPGSGPSSWLAARLRATLGEGFLGASEPAPGRLFLEVRPEATAAAAAIVFSEPGARYVVSIGEDLRPHGGGFEVLHCFAFDARSLRGALRVRLPAEAPRLPSITPIVAGASWSEREMRDLLGIESIGHPDPRRLTLPDGFPEGEHPLRRDFPHDRQPAEDPAARFAFREPPPGTTVVQLGPFFPVLEEPSQWRVFVDGEQVVGCDYRGFYCHRGIEKLADSVLGWNEVVALAERICGICGCVHATSYCQAVEEAAGIEVPVRARFIRTLLLELERVHSHLLWVGLACHIVGFDYGFMHAWRLREPIMDLAEHLTGSRKHYASNVVGGVALEVPAAKHARIAATVDTVERGALEMVRALEGDAALVARLQGVGVLTRDEIRAYGVVGPTARASGVPMDARRDHPFAAYPLLEFDVITDDGGDVWGRTRVRLGETFQSVALLRQCVRHLAGLPEGGLVAHVPDHLPEGREGFGCVEAPRGEVFHYVRTGARRGPERWRVRAPSYQNLQAVPAMFKPGTTIADVPIALGSADPCFSCTERMEIVDPDGGARTLRHPDLVALCRADMKRRRARAGGRP